MEIFYSIKDKKLFGITGYVDNSYKVTEIIEMLQNKTNQFVELCNLTLTLKEKNEIRTDYIAKSSRYKSMRVFWIETDIVPDNAFVLDNDWTMHKWIEN